MKNILSLFYKIVDIQPEAHIEVGTTILQC